MTATTVVNLKGHRDDPDYADVIYVGRAIWFARLNVNFRADVAFLNQLRANVSDPNFDNA